MTAEEAREARRQIVLIRNRRNILLAGQARAPAMARLWDEMQRLCRALEDAGYPNAGDG